MSPNVHIQKWARVDSSILMSGVRIGRNAVVHNAILDKNVVVPDGVEIGVNHDHDRPREPRARGGPAKALERLFLLPAPLQRGKGGGHRAAVLLRQHPQQLLEVTQVCRRAPRLDGIEQGLGPAAPEVLRSAEATMPVHRDCRDEGAGNSNSHRPAIGENDLAWKNLRARRGLVDGRHRPYRGLEVGTQGSRGAQCHVEGWGGRARSAG